MLLSELLSSTRITLCRFCNNRCLNEFIFYCVIHDRCIYGRIRGLIRSHSNMYSYRPTGASFCIRLARCVCTRIFLVGSRSVLLSRACECSVCLHVARAHLTAWQRSGSQLQTVRTVALPQPPLHCSA